MHFLITAGGTREYIDPVRFISNASSGKMGYALAQAAVKDGHKVTLITAPVAKQPPNGPKVIKVQTGAQMFEAVQKHFGQCDCLIMAAAVADYSVVQPAKSKIKKTHQGLTLKLKPAVDILKWAGEHKKIKGQIVAGFALEDKKLRENAEKKLKEKKLDMIIANRPAVIGSKKTTVQIKMPGRKWLKFPQTSKVTIAKKIIALAKELAGTMQGQTTD